ncbi:MAG TPA: T9SS type A sorting domain-containing protein [Flavobacteriaceae bacterium]|nr:T9SS type A sorting domain-containing protein [Flavobacteriaceae bacterium]
MKGTNQKFVAYSVKILMFFVTACGLAQNNAWINEIHYDNDGGDTNEGIEIVIENPGNLHLYELSLFNTNGQEYGHIYLDDSSVFHGDTVSGFSFYVWYPTSIQNGSADGIALIYNGSVVPGQFLSYEGTLTATAGPAMGMTSTDIGITEGSNPFYESLQLTGAGSGYSNFSWSGPLQNTFGSVNMGQTIGGVTGNASPVIFNMSQNPVAENITPSSTVSVSSDIYDSDGISAAVLNWGISSGNLSNNITMNLVSGNNYISSSEIPAQPEGTSVFYTISATDGNSITATTDEKTYLVGASSVMGWQITETDRFFRIDFETTVENINEGEFAGTGFQPFPEIGQLDSNSWSITGFSDGDMDFGDSRIVQNEDLTQNTSTGGVGTGGIYAFVVGSSVCLGIQSTGPDFTPGNIVLRLQNKTGDAITEFQVSYDIFNRNDENRSNSFNLNYSADGLNYTNASVDFSSPVTASNFPYWKKNSKNASITGISVATDAYFYLQWLGDDLSGSGSRDEFGLDNISVIANPVSTSYVFNNAWSPNDPNGIADFTDNITVQSGTATFTENMIVNNISIASGAVLQVEQILDFNGSITNNGSLLFISDGTKFGQLAENEFTGNIPGTTVQRFIPARRAFRFVSPAVNSVASIHENWQEGAVSSTANPFPGFGTHITGSLVDQENGFDATGSGNPSLFLFDNAAQEWFNIENTDISVLEKGKPYRLFVRGDRSIDLTSNAAVPTNTILRATGTLIPGDYSNSNLSAVADAFNFVGNPFQAIVNMNAVLENSTNLNPNHYYIWDPTLNDRGGYVTIALPFGTNSTGSDATQFLQPGQAAFVRTLNNGPASILFEEIDKEPTESITNVFRGTLNDETTASINLQLFEAQTLLNDGPVADGFRLNFDIDGDNAVLPNDAEKMGNIDENIAVLIDGNYLSIANRSFPINGEIIPLFVNQYRHSSYTFKIELTDFSENTGVFLKDDFLQIQTELVNNSVNFYSFDIDGNSEASSASDRFSFLFNVNDLKFEKEGFSALSIYPNPVRNGRFFISIPKTFGEEIQVSICNAVGQKVWATTKFAKNSSSIEINSLRLKPGIYLVKIDCGGKSYIEKILVF